VSERFYGRDLDTAPGRVFTPRAKTERLVAEALALIGDRTARVADVGTGAGTIAVAVAVNAPAAEVWATDVSTDAVALARQNAERHGVADRVHVLVGDLLEPVEGDVDLILANLPYLSAATPLPAYGHEPAAAVYSSVDGLAHYRRLLAGAPARLRPGGTVLLQFIGEIFAAKRDELPGLVARLEREAPRLLTALIDSSVKS